MITTRLNPSLFLCGAALLVGCSTSPSSMDASTSMTTKTMSYSPQTDASVLQYVDPFIGTGGHGHTFPGAVVPFGMVQLSPDNVSKGWDWTAGYNYSDDELVGFSHTHLSGTGVGDLLDILVMPFRGDYSARRKAGNGFVISQYSHEKESASPGYYRVELEGEQVAAELTATERVGVHRYSFDETANGNENSNESSDQNNNKNNPAQILIDLGYAQNYDKSVATQLRVLDDHTVVGYRISTGWAKHQPVYFVAEFNQSFSHQLYIDGKPVDGQIIQGENSRISEIVLRFDDANTMPVEAKVGLSYVSIQGAKENLHAEAADLTFDQVKMQAEEKWAKQLNTFRVTDDHHDNKVKFYTALYHSFLAPQIFNDVNGAFYGADGSAHFNATLDKSDEKSHYERYSLFSLWDTFRALHPLLTISDSDKVNDMVKSMLGFYQETGVLPTWDLMSNETDVMIGYHAVPVIVDAYLKGLTDADPELIFAAVKASATQKRFGIDLYDEYGYIPSELEVEAVSKTLEYAFDDWAIAQLAKALGKDDEFAYFQKRAQSYQRLFDDSTGFMRGKTADGEWVKNFSPTHVEHRKTDYTEANAWQYTWYVPHDVEGLINGFGSEAAFVSKLDELFTTSSSMEGDVSPDISGLIGQYAHGNEPCHHVPYLYSFTNEKWKGEARIREIREAMYKTGPEGLSGNDDLGQMSAWYVFSALGFYPVNPASGDYVLGTPLFDKVEIALPDQKTFVITKQGESKQMESKQGENKQGKNKEDNNGENYVKSVQLNQAPLNNPQFSHKQLMNGGTLNFQF
ncbi:GH92 family glycosyl hydrolase [Marinibactrum halimedae]|uniref:Alpha-1 2-mannosidase n=1 Tax=Marinibactrum halimedae TaxID=1444977 RepID=A0AA37WNN8_9GAMM|nr:GH92 family glycosyl hydrolase [Marinibactrum halimedae]MCD9460713.1 GH92 family glycosyl hydrolase [Marinibactrum halimedae]GLS25162.1 alpha-1 2-mannosidase [Marinibactrum halimedae]